MNGNSVNENRSRMAKKVKTVTFLAVYAFISLLGFLTLKFTMIQYETCCSDSKHSGDGSGSTYDVDDESPMVFDIFETPFSDFKYPLDVDMMNVLKRHRQNKTIPVKPINTFPYKYIYNNDRICMNKEDNKPTDVFLLILVKSAVQNFQRRLAIRKTWGKHIFVKDVFKCVFFTGTSENRSLQYSALAERKAFQDVIQIDFKDNYYNNTLKTIGRFKWAVEYCEEAKFVLLVDDDFLVFTGSLISYLEDLKSYRTDHLYMGNVFDFPKPYRSFQSKWSVSIHEYPYEKYPSFVSAGAVLMSMSFVKDFAIAMQYTKLFKYDDVFMAIVALKLKVIPVGNRRFHMAKVPYLDNKYFDDILISHGYGDPKELTKAWSCLTYKICNSSLILKV